MELNNKIFWFLIVLCYCITFPSCRTLKRAFRKEIATSDSNEKTTTNSTFYLVDSSKKDLREFITYKFTFKDISDFEFPTVSNRSIPLDSIKSVKDLVSTVDLDRLIDRVESLEVNVQRSQSEHNAITNTGSEETKTEKNEKEVNLQVDSSKESDSTWAANVPWYAWVIGALLIFGIAVYSWKQIKPF